MRNISIISCFALATCFAVKYADACTCIENPSVCSSFSKTPVVFVGKVTSVEESTSTIQRFGKTEVVRTGLLAHFDVERNIKGIPEDTDKIDIGTGPTNCMYPFEAGKRYIVYADYSSYDKEARELLNIRLEYDLYTDICRRTQPLPEGQNDIDLIEALLKGKPEARIFGTIVLNERELSRGPYAIKNKGGVSGVKIEARSETDVFNIISDNKGNFQFCNVPEGKYKVRPILPSSQSGFLGSYDPFSLIEIRLPEYCGRELIFLIQSNGVIRGRVLDIEGRPVGRNIEVSLILADSATNNPSANIGCSDWTNDDSTYEFNGLVPGNYIIGIGLMSPPNIGSPYAGIYYPQTTRLDEAQVFRLREGEKFNNIDIRLPSTLPSFEIRGMVINRDGTPAIGAQIELIDVEYGKTVIFPVWSLVTDTDGTFSVPALKERRYQVRAYLAENYSAGTGDQSEPIEVITTNDLRPLVLKLDKPGVFRHQSMATEQ